MRGHLTHALTQIRTHARTPHDTNTKRNRNQFPDWAPLSLLSPQSPIQIFDSWAGLLEEKDLPNYVYSPTLNLVNYVKSLNVPVICFPREIKNYKEFCDIVKPDAVNIDYNVDPKKILRDISIPIQGGLDPKILLTDKETLKKEAFNYLEIFRDHPYIFNLGHGILPETNPEMVENLIKIVKDFK